MSKLSFALISFALLGTAACKHNTRATDTTAYEPAPAAVQAAADQDASVVAEISFVRGKKDLTAGAKDSIRSVVNQAKARGQIDNLMVIAWADEEFPSQNAGQLSKAQRDLADARGREIRNFVAALDDDIDVDTYNMAERANAFERMMSTSDARVKRSLENAGIPNTDSKVRIPSKRGKAIVMAILED